MVSVNRQAGDGIQMWVHASVSGNVVLPTRFARSNLRDGAGGDVDEVPLCGGQAPAREDPDDEAFPAWGRGPADGCPAPGVGGWKGGTSPTPPPPVLFPFLDF